MSLATKNIAKLSWKARLLRLFVWHMSSVDEKGLALLVIIFAVGFITTFSAINAISTRIYVNPNFLLVKHILSITIGVVLFMFFITREIEYINYISLISLVLVLLAIYLLPFYAVAIKGSKRWFDLGIFSLQPSEILKPFFVVVNGIFVNKIGNQDSAKSKKGMTMSIALIVLTGGGLLIQPDIGMFIVYLSVWAIQIFICGMRMRFFYILSIVFLLLSTGLYITLPHFKYRLHKYLEKSIDASSYYQAFKAKQALISGGFFGQGVGDGKIKYQIPDSYSDYVFCVMIEEYGYLATAVFLCIYFIFLLRQFFRATLYASTSIRLLIVGFSSMLTIPFLIHLGVNSNLLPNKGMIWPLVSYGGSSTISNFIILGMLFSITRKDRYNIFKFNNLRQRLT